MEEENKILLTSLSSIDDNNIHEFIRSEQARIIWKRKEQQQQPPITPIFYGQYFWNWIRRIKCLNTWKKNLKTIIYTCWLTHIPTKKISSCFWERRSSKYMQLKQNESFGISSQFFLTCVDQVKNILKGCGVPL